MEAIVQRQLDGNFALIVADDHPSVAQAVCQICQDLLGADRKAMTTVNCSQALLEVCKTPATEPRIIVLDLVMPGDLKRAALVSAVRRADPAARVVVYSADESAFLVKAVMTAGAMAYVSKSSPTAELVDAIVAVSQGRPYTDGRIDLRALESHPWATLTESERAVLIAFCRGDKAADIMASTGRSYSTITTHKYNSIQKLKLRNVSDVLPYLYANGLICELDEPPTA